MSFMGPQTYECTISNDFVTSLFTSLPHFVAYYLSSVLALQINVEVGREILCKVISFIMLWSAKMLLTSKCLSPQCHYSAILPPTRKCTKLATSAQHTSIKVIWYKFPSCWAIATTPLFAPLIIHCLFEIAHTIRLTKTYSPIVSWSATWACVAYLWCKF